MPTPAESQPASGPQKVGTPPLPDLPAAASDSYCLHLPLFISVCLSVCTSHCEQQQTDPCGPPLMPKPHSLTHNQNSRSRIGLPTLPKARESSVEGIPLAPCFSALATSLPLLVSPTFPASLYSFPDSDLKIRLRRTGGEHSFPGWLCPFCNAGEQRASHGASSSLLH